MSVSVIIIAKNEEEYIKQCLQSLEEQSFQDFEVIVVDDNSEDSTFSIAEEHADKVFKNQGEGRGSARNHGVKNAKGEVLAFLDADARAGKKWLENLIKNFEKGAQAVVGKVKHASKKKNLLTTLLEIDAEYRKNFDKKVVEYLDTANCAIKKEVFKNHEVFEEDERLVRGTDTYLVNVLKDKGVKIIYEPRAVVKHYDLPTSWSAYARKELRHGEDFSQLFTKTKDLRGYEHVRPWLYAQPILYYSLLTPTYPYNLAFILLATLLLNSGFLSHAAKNRARLVLPAYALSLFRNLLWFLGSVKHLVKKVVA